MEDIELFYNHNEEHNTWAVNFLNTAKLNASEIRDIFDKFGPMKRLYLSTPSGDGIGTCFVNFLAKSSAVACIKELQNHHIIQLRAFRQKVEKQKKNNDFTKKCEDDGGFSSSRRHENRFKNSKNDLYTSTTSLASMESSSSWTKIAPAQKNTDINKEMANSSGGNWKNESITNKSAGDQVEILTAHEVIVANVHDAYSENFVLDLLKKYEPIAASEMKSIPSCSLRYCHVYFMTPQQAQAAESNYDCVRLDDQELIVLRATTLSDEVDKH